jgi:hypothetical protein
VLQLWFAANTAEWNLDFLVRNRTFVAPTLRFVYPILNYQVVITDTNKRIKISLHKKSREKRFPNPAAGLGRTSGFLCRFPATLLTAHLDLDFDLSRRMVNKASR